MRSPTSFSVVLYFTLVLSCLPVSSSWARSPFVDGIPNGNVFSCNTSHDQAFGLNRFGDAFKTNGFKWDSNLSALDSDGDGAVNGVELQDQSGIWQHGHANPGNPGEVSNPGDASSVPTPPTPTLPPRPTPTNTPTQETIPTPRPTSPAGLEYRQWASTATASSQGGNEAWSAMQAAGRPDTDTYGDHPTAWAPESSGDGPEWLELRFPEAVYATGVRVCETYNNGFIYQVDLIDVAGKTSTVWSGEDKTPQGEPSWFEISLDPAPCAVIGVKIHTRVRGWEEIDAVELIGSLVSEPATTATPTPSHLPTYTPTLPSAQSSRSGWIFFVNKYGLPDMSLLAMSPDDFSVVTLAKGPYFSVASSRDGSMLVFTGPHLTIPARVLYAIPSSSGSQPVLLTPPVGWSDDASFSPDKTMVVYHVYIPAGGGSSDDLPTPPSMPTATSTPLPLDGAKPNKRSGSAPVFSPRVPQGSPPSGEYVAIAHLDGSDAARPLHDAINPGGVQIAPQIWRSPDWHPKDQNKIAVSIQHYPSPSFTTGLFITNPEGTQIQPLFTPELAGYEHDDFPTWSPDGEYLVYVRSFGYAAGATYIGKHNLYVMRGDGSDAPGQPITPDGLVPPSIVVFGIMSPSWSPDGQWIVFSAGTQGYLSPTAFDLYMVRHDGTGLRRLTNDGSSLYPEWYPGTILPNLVEPPPAPTPTVIAPISPTPTRTFTPTETPTAARTAVPVAEQVKLEDMGVFVVEHFAPPILVDYGAVPTDNAFPGATDGQGMLVFLSKGQGALCIADRPFPGKAGLVELSVSVRSTTEKVRMALVAFASPVDGSLGYVNPINSEVPVNKWGKMRLVYDSPTQEIIPALQFVVPEDAPQGINIVYADTCQVSVFLGDIRGPIQVKADGTFDTVDQTLLGLNPNMFLPAGEPPGTVSLTEGMIAQGVRLALIPTQLAAHVALFSLAPQMPTMVHGSVYVKKESGDDGTLAFVITDGGQSVGCFLKAKHLPLGVFKQIRLGGNFEIDGKQIPPIAVVQLGGPNVTGSIIIDNLELDTRE